MLLLLSSQLHSCTAVHPGAGSFYSTAPATPAHLSVHVFLGLTDEYYMLFCIKVRDARAKPRGLRLKQAMESPVGSKTLNHNSRCGAALGVWCNKLQVLAQVEQGSAHELAFSMLLSLALIPAAQQAVADQGEVQQLVQVSGAACLVAAAQSQVVGCQCHCCCWGCWHWSCCWGW